jgi:hypothetical protein
MCNMFGGVDGEQQNVLMTALQNSAEGEEKIYSWISSMPKTSLIVHLSDEIKELGYKIIKL